MDGWRRILELVADAQRRVSEVPGCPASDHPAVERVGPLAIGQMERQRYGEKEADEKGEDNRGHQMSTIAPDPLRDPTGVGKGG